MAEIHLARLAGEAGFEKTVVVKRLLPELVASKAFVAMFLDEGKLVARLDHPNVCEVHELGRDGAEYFIVMPYLDGVPASDFIARPRDPDRIAQLRVATGIITQACAGLHHAHELKGTEGALLGLVHRDVSPSNLFITTAGVVKVLDFGIAKVHGGAETEAGTIKGKTQYMAPEQLLGEQLDRRCDVFALGIVLFELATHSRLFKRSSDYLAARAILEENIPRANAIDPAVPPALADVIGTALDRAKDKRYADAKELGKAIDAAMAAHGGVASAAEIAAALADWHGAELSAMRTRQAKVIEDARSRVEPTTIAGKLKPDESRMLTMPRDVVRKKRRGVIVLAVLVIGATGAVLALSLARESQRNQQALAPHVDAAAAITAPPEPAPAIEPAHEEPPPAPVIDTPAPKPSRPSKKTPVKTKVADKPPPVVEPAQPAALEPGKLSIGFEPYATIYVDNKKLGETPIVKRSIPAGKHKLKAVAEDGRIKTFDINIQPGKHENLGTLNW
jgi:eukaryotic-like serine/threonine-protein kinase